MYFYFSPTGGGVTSDQALASQMRQLRDEYMQAWSNHDEEAKKRILEEESALAEQVRKTEPVISHELQDCAEMIRRMGKTLSFE